MEHVKIITNEVAEASDEALRQLILLLKDVNAKVGGRRNGDTRA